MKDLFESLKDYSKSNVCPMHMPGHKRNTNLLGADFAYDIDITEIDGFDNLHNAEGILKQSQQKASQLFGSKQSYYLVNGSTCGLISAIRACTKHSDKIIISRNCHKSVYNAISLCRLKSAYITTQTDSKFGVNESVGVLAVKQSIKDNPDAKVLLITSPTYDGVVSDVKTIAKVCHENGIILIVDEAHGAHFGMNKHFPQSAVKLGADVVVQSLHKTLPSLTQTAILHICSDRVDEIKIQEQLAMFQTSSPSYILLASIDRCIAILTKQKEQFFKRYVANLKQFSAKMKSLKNLCVLCHGKDKNSLHKGFFDFDFGKIVISTKNSNISGHELMNILRNEYKIELEMEQSNYAIAMTSICDDCENFDRLASALLDIDNKLIFQQSKDLWVCDFVPKKKYEAWEVENEKYKPCEFEKSEGKICAEKVWVYPPGVPIIVEGEILDSKTINLVRTYITQGLNVHGSRSGNLSNFINVVDNEESI